MSQKPLTHICRLVILIALVALLAAPLSAAAASFVVNTDDDLDDGLCDVSHCSLREAINAANANAGPDSINFDVQGPGTVSIHLNAPLPALTDASTTIDGTSEPDYAGSPVIYLGKASGVMEVGLLIESNGNVVRGLGLAGFGAWPEGPSYHYQDLIGGAIVLTGSDNLIQDNAIGLGAWWNSVGVRVSGSGNSVVDNVISGNGAGIYANLPNTVIQGNIIGASADGTTAVHNGYGVVLYYGADGTLVGGAAPGEGNLISANHELGLQSNSDNNVIYGNIIGLDGTGTSAMPNEGHGIIATGENTTIGGSAPGQGNVISGNDYCGIWINDQGNVIQGNKIGTDISGSVMIPNGWCGIESEASPITIGGLGSGEGNLIMGNAGIGLAIDDLGQHSYVAGNTIALNGMDGIEIWTDESSAGNTFTRNSIYQNGKLGIETNGFNENIQYPVLSSGLGTTITGTACLNCVIEIFKADPDPTWYGEGKDFISVGVASSNGSFSIPIGGAGFCIPITATATDANGNTSEFSENVYANCIRLKPLFLYPIWSFIIIVFAGIMWVVRRAKPAMHAWYIPLGALCGGLLFLALVMVLPFVEVEFTPRSTCGDGVVNASEQCDGDDLTMCRSDQVCKHCRCVTEVLAPYCGDGDVDEDEQCDGDDLTMCRSDQVCENCRCITMVGMCGNGVRDEDEQCDGDDLSFCLSGQVCENCRCITMVEMCGNGIVDEWEQCDGDDLSFCLSGQVCEDCQCVTHVEAEPVSELCVYEARVNTNCRESDYKESEQIAILMQEEMAELVALNPEYTHGLFELETGKQCWMWLGLLDGPENPYGTCDVRITDPPEKPSELTCQRDLDEENCIAAGGEWVVGIAPICHCPGD